MHLAALAVAKQRDRMVKHFSGASFLLQFDTVVFAVGRRATRLAETRAISLAIAKNAAYYVIVASGKTKRPI